MLSVIEQALQSPSNQPWIWLSSGFGLLSLLLRFRLFCRLQELVRYADNLRYGDPAGLPRRTFEGIERLRQRMLGFLEKYDEVNTGALVEKTLAQERVFGRFSLEQADYLTRTIPNVLIAIGLLGTFLGIVVSLYSIANYLMALAAGTGGTQEFLDRLSQPIEGMSMAFVSSLTSLTWGIVLTLFNALYNTTLLRQQLFATLELYLDHELASQERSPTRQLIQSIADNFRVFLDNFHQTVREAIERPLERELGQLTTLHADNAQLARDIYRAFADAAGNLLHGSQVWETSARSLLESQFADKLSTAAQHLSQFTDQLAAAVQSSAQLNQAVVELNQKVLAVLETFTQTQIEFQGMATELKVITETLAHVSAQVEQTACELVQVAKAFHATQENLSQCVEHLGRIQGELSRNRKHLERQYKLLGSLEPAFATYRTELMAELRGLADGLKDFREQVIHQYHRLAESLGPEWAAYKTELLAKLQGLADTLHNFVDRFQQTVRDALAGPLEQELNQSAVIIAHLETLQRQLENLQSELMAINSTQVAKLQGLADRLESFVDDSQQALKDAIAGPLEQEMANLSGVIVRQLESLQGRLENFASELMALAGEFRVLLPSTSTQVVAPTVISEN